MLFDHHPPAECQQALPKLSKAIAEGIGQEQLKEEYPEFSTEDFAELFSIAKARHHGDKLPAEYRNQLWYTEEDLRFCTNWVAAKYRAKRLKCGTLIEVGCGIGIQTIAFAETCETVYGIELDARRIRYAQENAKIAGCRNITFIQGDALEKLAMIPNADILFCEPERDAEAVERRFGDLKPNITKLISAAAKLTNDCCIELPPQLKSIPLEGEREYLSVDGKLNRLQVYTGKLAKCAISVVSLPSEARLERDAEDRSRVLKSGRPAKYLYQLDAAVIKAGLQGQLLKTGMLPVNEEFVTATAPLKNPFFAKTYRIVARVPFDQGRILAELQRQKAGKAIIRYPIDPQRYWKERNGYENHLRGNKPMQIFQFGDAYLAEEVFEH